MCHPQYRRTAALAPASSAGTLGSEAAIWPLVPTENCSGVSSGGRVAMVASGALVPRGTGLAARLLGLRGGEGLGALGGVLVLVLSDVLDAVDHDLVQLHWMLP